MKFCRLFFLIALFLGFLNISCLKNEAPAPVEEPHVPEESFIYGKILSKKADLCLFGRDYQMHSVIKLSAGDDISVLEIDGIIDEKFVPDESADSGRDSSTSLRMTGDSLRMTGGSPKMTDDDQAQSSETAVSPVEISGTRYVHAVHKNMDFWIEDSVFALNCENAVAIEKTFLYSDQNLTQKIDSPQNPLKFASLIAKSVEKSADDNAENPENLNSSNPNSVKIFFYDTAKKSVCEAFVQSSSISARIDDIVVSQIAEELKVTKRAVPRNELFKKAAKYNPCKKVLAALNAQKVETKSYNYQEVLKSMQRMSFGVNVDELMTVDQSKDPFK